MIITYLPVVVYLHAVRSILQGADMLDHPTRRQRCCRLMAAPCWCGGATAASGRTPPDRRWKLDGDPTFCYSTHHFKTGL